MKIISSIVVFVLVFISTSTYAQKLYNNWGMGQVDAHNSGYVSWEVQPDATAPTMEFSSYLPVSTRHTPIVANNCYYLLEEETNTLVCTSLHSNEVVWKKQYHSTSSELQYGNVCVYDDTNHVLLLLETTTGEWDSKENFSCTVTGIQPSSGDVIWSVSEMDGYAGSVVVENGIAYVKLLSIIANEETILPWMETSYFSGKHAVLSIQTRNGLILWQAKDLSGGEICFYTNPVGVSDKYVLTSASINYIPKNNDRGNYGQIAPCYVTLLRKETGEVVDTDTIDDYVGISSPCVWENQFYLNAIYLEHPTIHLPNCLFHYKVNAVQEKLILLRSFSLSESNHSLIYRVNFVQWKDYLYYIDFRGFLKCLSLPEGKTKWKTKVGSGSLLHPYFCTPSHVIVCTQKVESLVLQYFQPSNGELLYETSVPFEGNGPIEVNGSTDHIWVLIRGGTVAEFIPAVPITLHVKPNRIEKTCRERDGSIFKEVLTLYTTGKIKGTIRVSSSWIQCEPEEISEETEKVIVVVDTTSFSWGKYTGEIQIQTNGGNVTIPVQVHVQQKPDLVVQPDNIIKEITIGQNGLEILQLSNHGGKELNGTVTSTEPWMLPSISTYNDTTQTLELQFFTKNLKAGIYNGSLLFVGNHKTIVVSVQLQMVVTIRLTIGSKKVFVNEKLQMIEASPYLFENRTFIPVRKLVESLPLVDYLKNSSIKWDSTTQTIYIQAGTISLLLRINDPVAELNGEKVKIDQTNLKVVPQIKEGRTFVPLRFIAEALGYKVYWDSNTQSVTLVYKLQN